VDPVSPGAMPGFHVSVFGLAYEVQGFAASSCLGTSFASTLHYPCQPVQVQILLFFAKSERVARAPAEQFIPPELTRFPHYTKGQSVGTSFASILHYTCQHKTTIRDHTLYIWSYIVTIGWHGKCKASPQARALARALQAYCKRRAILASARRATDRLRMGRARNMPSAKPHRITG
jgi:hypothetical protein